MCFKEGLSSTCLKSRRACLPIIDLVLILCHEETLHKRLVSWH